jgi:DNA-binding NarL/FixJ family response regulator
MTDTEIARELGIDLKDIKSKVEALIESAGVKSRAEFVVWALKNKII